MITLDDKYTATQERVFLSGTQALVRLPIEQARRDAVAGHNTAGFVSGYRGSPLGHYDNELWAAERHLKTNRIHFEPGINEDLAATAVWGSQQVPLMQGARFDGVFGLWYGKGPGVDRSTDALKHANFAGTSPLGGAIALCGDDHAARSSTIAHQSDHALIHCGMPVFNPTDIQEYIDLGLMAFAMSRFCGLWVGFKCITDIVDGSANVLPGDHRIRPIVPLDFEMPVGGLSIRREVAALAQEVRLFDKRLEAAKAFARANSIDRIRMGAATGHRRLGIVTTGKGLADVSEAFKRLGMDQRSLEASGIGVYNVGMVWPLEPERIRSFAEECDEVLVVEEKRPLIEEQLAHILYTSPADRRPRLLGKRDASGARLLPETGELSPDIVLKALAERIDAVEGTELTERVRELTAQHAPEESAPPAVRVAAFCAGCPHNTSTRVPEGSVAMAGIGCHGMAAFMPDRPTLPVVHMGGEGAAWIGHAPFTDTPHVFQNLGDGTYFHSGLLAIRACVAANVPITYKILLNGAVGMTGGQPIEGEEFAGEITAPHVAHQVSSEGVRRVAVVSDEADRFAGQQARFPAGTSFHHRSELDAVQRELREFRGVSVLIYDQSCATERRRLRKRGKIALADTRAHIASAVCEGCGDCGVQSNCIAIEPLDTEFGRKRQINQSTCNQDLSCLNGFCPSFITVKGGGTRSGTATRLDHDMTGGLPEPVLPQLSDSFSVLVTGIGGAGVVTIGAVLGMAAHISSCRVSVLDMSGFAQRNGSVMSHLRISKDEALRTLRIPSATADVVIGCDPIVTAGPESLAMMKPATGRVVLNRFLAPTSSFAQDPDLKIDETMLERRIAGRVGASNLFVLDATTAATRLLGNAIGANMMLVGHAWQSGLIPIGREAIESAIRLNGTAVEMNLRAFALGRLAAARPEAVTGLLDAQSTNPPEPETLADLLASRERHLTEYQNAALALRYRTLVDRVAAAESALELGTDRLAYAVAGVYARLLAYKDEYEVARLLTSDTLRGELQQAFEGDYRIAFNLGSPLLLCRRDPSTGRLKKREFGAWMRWPLRMVAGMKGLRGTPLDLVGLHPHRKMERALIREFEALVEEILASLSAASHADAVKLTGVFGLVRGYDIVKEASVERMRKQLEPARAAFYRAEAQENQQSAADLVRQI
jgi:indolepyruvate ferredoxin oxidoreductase